MSKLNEPGSRYWSIIEPHWLRLNESWDHGAKHFLSNFQNVPMSVGHLYAAHWCQSEVSNGGLFQFFWNTSGILSPEASKGFAAIGIVEWSKIVDEAMQSFGTSYPRNRNDRLKILARYENHEKKPFDALDERFFDWIGEDYDRWRRAADAFAENITT